VLRLKALMPYSGYRKIADCFNRRFEYTRQNGRAERFFSTLKTSLDRLAVTSFDALNSALGEFRFFYNHVRSHRNLAGATPAEAWAGVNPHITRFKQEYWFEARDGLLQGDYLRR
jgi:putative transposase